MVCLVVGVFRGARNRVRDCDQSGRLVVVARLEFSYARRGFFTLGYASAKSEYVYEALCFEIVIRLRYWYSVYEISFKLIFADKNVHGWTSYEPLLFTNV